MPLAHLSQTTLATTTTLSTLQSSQPNPSLATRLAAPISIIQPALTGHRGAGDAPFGPKTCSLQASIYPTGMGEKHTSMEYRRDWFLETLKIETGDVLTDIVIAEGNSKSYGVVVEHNTARTLYFCGTSQLQAKEGLVILLDLAIDCLDCNNIVLILERQSFAGKLESILHDLSWVGFELLAPESIAKVHCSEEYLFIGMEL